MSVNKKITIKMAEEYVNDIILDEELTIDQQVELMHKIENEILCYLENRGISYSTIG